MSTVDQPTARRLSGELTDACAFMQTGDMNALVDAARHQGASTETVALALVLFAQNAAWNGEDEAERAALQTAGALARLITPKT